MANQAALLAIVHGFVQGVNFRAFVRREARELGLTGYTRNLRDGGVEVVAEGNMRDLELLIKQLHRGPRLARVDKVDVGWARYSGRYKGFELRF